MKNSPKKSEKNSWAAKEIPHRVIFTRGGTPFDPNEDLWHWTEDVFYVHIDFSKLPITPELRCSLKGTLANFAQANSVGYVTRLFRVFQNFATHRTDKLPLANITISDISSYSASLTEKKRPNLGILSTLLQRWVILGNIGVDRDASTFLTEQRKPGGTKGDPVRTRDPMTGPYSEAEYTALYKAVDAVSSPSEETS